MEMEDGEGEKEGGQLGGGWRGRGGRSISCATAATLSLSADFRRDHQTIERDTHHRLPARATGADSSQP